MEHVALEPRDSTLKPAEDPDENSIDWEIEPAFEEILDAIGSRGKFQKRLNVTFNYIGSSLNIMSLYLFHLAVQTPDHWCHVPGREYTNWTLKEWKDITVPWEGDSFSKCTMYSKNSGVNVSEAAVIPCQHGWDYDDTWFSLTVTSQSNWVCDRQYILNNIMFNAQIIAIALVLLFGYIGDMFGRRPQFFLCISTHVISRVMLVLTPTVPVMFTLAVALVAAACTSMFDSSLSVGLELTDVRYRATLSSNLSICIGTGIMAISVIAWAMRTWSHYSLLMAVCLFVLLLFYRWFPESPRWLACRGHEQEALVILKQIAATNGTTVPPITQQVLHTMAKCKEDRKGFLSIFSSWNLFKNTLLLIIARSVYVLTVSSMVLSVGFLSTNPYISMAAQGAVVVLGFYVGHYCASHYGRRWSSVVAMFLAGVMSATIILLMSVDVPVDAVMAMTTLATFFVTANGGVGNLQSIEVHPTCLRQIAVCVEVAASCGVLSLLPYIVFLGSSLDKRLPFAILSGLNLMTAFSVSFLPETALQRLPESLQDAAVFGKGRPYWSWKPKPPPSCTRTID